MGSYGRTDPTGHDAPPAEGESLPAGRGSGGGAENLKRRLLVHGPIFAGMVSLALVWGLGQDGLYGADRSGIRKAVVLVWLLGAIMWCAVGVMRHAEALAHRLGEPRGTLILTISAISIEVSIIAVMMVSGQSTGPTLARDAMFSILMIILGGFVGFTLLAGGFRHRVQDFNLEGARAFLVMLLPLATIALILPNHTVSTDDATLNPVQAVFFGVCTLVLYGIFLFMQTRRHTDFFQQPASNDQHAATPPAPRAHEPETEVRSIPYHAVLLFVTLLPIPLLAHELDHVLEVAVFEWGIPAAIKGVIVAALVLTPEGITAVRAAWDNQMQRSVNLLLGSALSTVSLTVPTVLIIGLITGHPVVLGLDETSTFLLILTLLVSSLTFSGARTDMLKGAVHLLLFVVFLALIIQP